jgi:hypothetical protein
MAVFKTEKEAKDFLQRTMTVVGSSDAIKDKKRVFLEKYATAVYSPDAIDIVAPKDPGAPTDLDDQGQTGDTGSTGSTGSTDDQGSTGSTGSTDAGAGEGTDTED